MSKIISKVHVPLTLPVTPLNTTISLCNVTINRGDNVLCQHVNAQFDMGQIWHIQGENGLGKTTLLMMLAGLLPSHKHQISWDNLPTTEWQTLYLGHRLGLNDKLTVLENLAYLSNLLPKLKTYSTAEQLHRNENALYQVGLAGYEDTPISKLSSGQKRRVGLARLWLCDTPMLWLLDEPFTALDIYIVQQLNQKFNHFVATGGCVLLTSHQPVESATHQLDLSPFKAQTRDEFLSPMHTLNEGL